MTGDRFEIVVPGSPRHLRAVRSMLRAAAENLKDVHLSDRALADLQLALHEACINAIRHGEKDRPHPLLRVAIIVETDRLTVEVRDHGPGFDPEQVPVPDGAALREGGYGVHIMKKSVDAVAVRREGGEFVVALTRVYDLGPASAARSGK